eukprot:2493836-Prymnesium_polylepis.3
MQAVSPDTWTQTDTGRSEDCQSPTGCSGRSAGCLRGVKVKKAGCCTPTFPRCGAHSARAGSEATRAVNMCFTAAQRSLGTNKRPPECLMSSHEGPATRRRRADASDIESVDELDRVRLLALVPRRRFTLLTAAGLLECVPLMVLGDRQTPFACM